MSDFCDMSDNFILNYDEGWDFMEKGIKKLIESLPNPHFTIEDSLMLYTNGYNMCCQMHPHDYSRQLYQQYKKTFKDYIRSTVLPSLRGKKEELLLRELLERWSNHKIMTKYMFKFFRFLDMHYISNRRLPSLEATAFLTFYSLVYDKMHREIMDAILAMIARKRAGESIDEELVKNALAFYTEIGEKTRKDEPKHFAETMMKENAIIASFGIFKLEV